MDKIGFWKANEPYGEFSNWYICNFMYEGIRFISSEQALMWKKAKVFNDIKIADKILKTDNQAKIKALGRKVSNYDEEVWSTIRYAVMCDILNCKFGQNEELRKKLLDTGNASLYEASPLDSIWGIGSTDVNSIKGKNILGKALMFVRDTLIV